MKLYLSLLAVLVVAATSLNAQNFNDLYSAVSRYDCVSKLDTLVDQPVPHFDFGNSLTDQTIKGKTTVMVFWASWCMPCRSLTSQIDSVLIRSGRFDHVRFIGVDSGERSAEKASNYWSRMDQRFVMVDGAKADSCAKSVDAGHPTALVIDSDGIIRARWDSAGESVAQFIALKIDAVENRQLPEPELTVESAEHLLSCNEWLRALYLLDRLPTTTRTEVDRFEAICNFDSFSAARLGADVSKLVEGSDQKEKFDRIVERFELRSEIDDWIKALDDYFKTNR